MGGNPWEAHADVLSIDDALIAGRKTLNEAREEYRNALDKARNTYNDCVKAREDAEQVEKDSKAQLEKEEEEIQYLWKEIEACDQKIASYEQDGKDDAANSEAAWRDSLYADVSRHEEKKKDLWEVHANAEENLKGCREDEEAAKEALDQLETGVANRLRQIEDIESRNQAELSKKKNDISSK